MARPGSSAAPMPIAAVQTAAIVAKMPARLAKGFSQMRDGGGVAGAGKACGAAGTSPCNPFRIRSGVNGGSRKRTPVASKIAFAIAAALGTDADSPTPSGGWSGRGSSSTSILGTSGNGMIG